MKKHVLLIVFLCSSMFLFAQQSERKGKKTTTNSIPPMAEQQLDFTSEKKAPEYNGGKQAMFKFIHQNMKYPADAKEKGIQGDVLLKFTVGIDGAISNVEVLKGLYPSLDAEAIRVLKKMPNWIPGKYGNQPASMKSSLIIGFHLTE